METAHHKQYISAEQMEKDCWAFAKDLFRKGLDFDLFVGVTRGGAQVSIYMQEVFMILTGKKKDYATIQACSYTGFFNARNEVGVENVEAVIRHVKPGIRILVVDDIFDRGKTFEAVRDAIVARLPYPDVHLSMAALYYKPENSQVSMKPDYFYRIFGAKDWIVLPHELEGLSREEMACKGFVWP
ncbi:phosphoribosyltransferase [Desulfobotulus sp.]|jgi:hypoxanthine phosphoribosyltransferase|uniref:phosphoribosyltransferase n=1 Tax=Desulfobotulus sp. TaxID=1940337 RepID=UPI002A362534|nr:phosphoribosyltransferase family protein [Desulfobotulus sp.]MDY0161928.1 phosphoribosyltransferase family protein [Desulfobotulus sp.]